MSNKETIKLLDIIASQKARIAELEAEIAGLNNVVGLTENEIDKAQQQLTALREVYRYAKGLCMGEDWNKGTAALYYRKPLREAVEKVTLQESSDELG